MKAVVNKTPPTLDSHLRLDARPADGVYQSINSLKWDSYAPLPGPGCASNTLTRTNTPCGVLCISAGSLLTYYLTCHFSLALLIGSAFSLGFAKSFPIYQRGHIETCLYCRYIGAS